MSMNCGPPEQSPGLALSRVWILLGLGMLLLASAAGAQVPPEFTSTPFQPARGGRASQT